MLPTDKEALTVCRRCRWSSDKKTLVGDEAMAQARSPIYHYTGLALIGAAGIWAVTAMLTN
jgi:hypothetical protein